MKPSSVSNDSAIVSSSLLEACRFLGITQDQLANIIGVSRATIVRIKKRTSDNLEDTSISQNSKAFELALLLIRIYRSLYSILGGNQKAMKHWMNTPNRHLDNKIPAELVQSALGLTQVLWYLDAMRGKL